MNISAKKLLTVACVLGLTASGVISVDAKKPGGVIVVPDYYSQKPKPKPVKPDAELWKAFDSMTQNYEMALKNDPQLAEEYKQAFFIVLNQTKDFDSIVTMIDTAHEYNNTAIVLTRKNAKFIPIKSCPSKAAIKSDITKMIIDNEAFCDTGHNDDIYDVCNNDVIEKLVKKLKHKSTDDIYDILKNPENDQTYYFRYISDEITKLRKLESGLERAKYLYTADMLGALIARAATLVPAETFSYKGAIAIYVQVAREAGWIDEGNLNTLLERIKVGINNEKDKQKLLAAKMELVTPSSETATDFCGLALNPADGIETIKTAISNRLAVLN